MSSISAGTTSTTTLVHSGDTTGSLVFKTNDTGSGGTTAVTIDTSQNVGIGTATPSSFYSEARNLVVGTGTGGQGISIYAGSASQSRLMFADGTSGSDAYTGFVQYSHADNALQFGTNGGTERMRIDSSGNLLVGVTSPSGGFNTIAATGSNWALVAKNLSTSGSVYGFKSLLSYAPNNTSSYFIGCEDNGTGRMYVYSNGNVVNTNNSYGAISDRTLKENIVDASPKLENLCKVKIRNFNLIGETTKQLGVVAQELEEIFPSMVEVDGNTQKKQVKYSVFVPMLVKAIQELKAINDQQAETINALTARVVALEGK